MDAYRGSGRLTIGFLIITLRVLKREQSAASPASVRTADPVAG